MFSAGDRTALLKYNCLAADKWSRYPATQDVNMGCNSITNLESATFCDGSIISPDMTFLKSSEVILESDSITTTGRVYQELDPSSSYETVNGFYGLAKDAYPALNPYSSAVKAVSTWVPRTTPADNAWRSVIWAPEVSLFVAVSTDGTNRVMTSPNGITWTLRASADDTNNWRSVVWSPAQGGRFVAVAGGGTTPRAMYSSTGTAWFNTLVTGVSVRTWSSVCWSPELDIYVAVAEDGNINRVMTSSDGIDWTSRTAAASNTWTSVCWSPELSLFVAVAKSGVGNRVMTSSDGITWVSRTSAVDNLWNSVCWSPELGLFAAVGNATTVGLDDRIMTSSDGITWTIRGSVSDVEWTNVVWAPELGIFYAKSSSLSAMYSTNGIEWKFVNVSTNAGWRGLCWSPEMGIFVAVCASGSPGLRVLTSSLTARPPTSYNVFDSASNSIDQLGNWTIQQVLKAGTATGIINTGPTPSVAGVNLLTISHSVLTTITDLTGGVTNQQVILYFNNGNTTIQSGSSIRLAGAANFAGTGYDTLTLLKRPTEWVEVCRSVNA
jgi:hypothetical protein